MTVDELIEELQSMPGHLPVIRDDSEQRVDVEWALVTTTSNGRAVVLLS